MNFEKYSKQRFEMRGLSSPAARELADELENDVLEELQLTVLDAFQKIIQELNANGHNLKVYGEIKAGDMSFRDEDLEGECNLRLACDVVISAGYSDTID